MLRTTVITNPMTISRRVVSVFCHSACRAWTSFGRTVWGAGTK
jgi:hypothetical protein